MRLAAAVVRVLSQNHHFDLVRGGQIQCVKQLVALWIDFSASGVTLAKRLVQFGQFGAVPHFGQGGTPCWVKTSIRRSKKRQVGHKG